MVLATLLALPAIARAQLTLFARWLWTQGPTVPAKMSSSPSAKKSPSVHRTDVTPTVLARIRALGGAVLSSVPSYRAIRAQLPLAGVGPLAHLAAVQTIRPDDEAVTRAQIQGLGSDMPPTRLRAAAVGAIDTSEGDIDHQADLARRTHSVDGAGIGNGVLSNGVDTLADRQVSGDLLARVTVLAGREGRGVVISPAFHCVQSSDRSRPETPGRLALTQAVCRALPNAYFDSLAVPRLRARGSA